MTQEFVTCPAHEQMLIEIGKRVPVWVLLAFITVFMGLFGGTFSYLAVKIDNISHTINQIDKKQALVLHELNLNGLKDDRK